MKHTTFKDTCCRYTGVWQENGDGAVVSYSQIAFCEVGFVGEKLLLEAEPTETAVYYVDGKETAPTVEGNTLAFAADAGEHLLKIKIYGNSRFALKSLAADGFFCVPDNRYVQFIGDSITHAYPGFSSAAPENLGVDYAVVAHCGMSLVDGWGWYEKPAGMDVRMGMESRYFLLQLPGDHEKATAYTFEYCRVPDELVIFLGTNDYLDSEQSRQKGNVQTFAEHYLAFVKRLREHFPQAKVHIMKPLSDKCCRNEGIDAAYSLISATLPDIHLIPAHTWGVQISADGTHPTPAGYARLAEGMTAYLKG